jgi:CBS domain containing-hemolysin-like protein
LPGSTPLHLLTGLAGLELEDGAAATIGGYVTDRLGRLPMVGDLLGGLTLATARTARRRN